MLTPTTSEEHDMKKFRIECERRGKELEGIRRLEASIETLHQSVQTVAVSLEQQRTPITRIRNTIRDMYYDTEAAQASLEMAKISQKQLARKKRTYIIVGIVLGLAVTSIMLGYLFLDFPALKAKLSRLQMPGR